MPGKLEVRLFLALAKNAYICLVIGFENKEFLNPPKINLTPKFNFKLNFYCMKFAKNISQLDFTLLERKFLLFLVILCQKNFYDKVRQRTIKKIFKAQFEPIVVII